MYWSKVATTEREFEAIAALNYETFVEEIPQHVPNEARLLVDRFHDQNTYIIVYKHTEIIGMVAFRDQRPFSLDGKIGEVENYLSAEFCEKLCEIRLLAVKKGYRNGRVFAKLATAIYRHFFDQGYSACVISGTVRQEKLYNQMGFRQFSEAIGSEEARYLPMVLTRAASIQFRERLKEENIVFYPGPVATSASLRPSVVSHRSVSFLTDFEQMNEWLLKLSQANHILTLVGTGTLANDAMLGQIRSDFPNERGLILVNGEFGERLSTQAAQWDLQADTIRIPWGKAFLPQEIEQQLQQKKYGWLLVVHGETSSGTLNPLQELVDLGKQYGVAVCVDCISSFGALPFSLADVHYATAVSGKSLGALSGLAFVFCHTSPTSSNAPYYLNLAHYAKQSIPFTLPHYLIEHVLEALQAYPERYHLLAERMELVEKSVFKEPMLKTKGYPMICTLQLPNVALFSETAKLNGLYIHDESAYLKQRRWVQISTIQPHFERDFVKIEKLFTLFNQIM